ncbi:MAG: CPBP family intramembrane metalloprotease [Halanaerobiales bacterium]|nr:CPBP family intramembrane metalloprotease [Halanaerobiales bacterium]
MKKLTYFWIVISLVLLIAIIVIMETSLPIFTMFWLIVPLIVLTRNNEEKIGIKKISIFDLLKYTTIHFLLLSIIYLCFEPWSGAYQLLIEIAVRAKPSDPTFVWLSANTNLSSYLIMFLVTIFITIFGEELFFRGFIYQYFKAKRASIQAIIIQAVFFTLPNLIVTLMMPLVQGLVYLIVYAFLGVGCIGGYTAYKTDSIWPSLISASLINLILVLILY